MSASRIVSLLSGAALALCLGTAAASAASAFAATTLNVRAGAGLDHRVVDTLRRGEAVEIDYCRGSWCLVSTRGGDGWVSASYLVAVRADVYAEPEIYIRPRVVYRPYFRHHHRRYDGPYFGASVCTGGRNVSFCFGN